MAFELPDGKIARTLPEQVKFLTEKLRDLYAAFNELGIKKVEIVESLPLIGQYGILYMVPVEDPDAKNYYEEYIWFNSQWEMIGTTKIDLSNYVDLTSAQTISGNKSFSGVVSFVGSINTSLNPETTNAYDLGSSSFTWRNIYVGNNIYAAAGSQLQSPGTLGIFGYVGTNTTGFTIGNGIIQANRNITATTNETRDLGSNSIRWLHTYTKNISNGTNTVSVADIAALIDYAKAQGWIP